MSSSEGITISLKRGEFKNVELSGGGDEPLKIVKIASGSPAHKQGLQQGDLLVSVNGISVRGKTPNVALLLIQRSVHRIVLVVTRGGFDKASPDQLQNSKEVLAADKAEDAKEVQEAVTEDNISVEEVVHIMSSETTVSNSEVPGSSEVLDTEVGFTLTTSIEDFSSTTFDANEVDSSPQLSFTITASVDEVISSDTAGLVSDHVISSEVSMEDSQTVLSVVSSGVANSEDSSQTNTSDADNSSLASAVSPTLQESNTPEPTQLDPQPSIADTSESPQNGHVTSIENQISSSEVEVDNLQSFSSTSTEGASLKVASTNEVSLKVASTDEVSQKVASVDETSLKVALADETSLEVASADEVSVKVVSADETSLEVVPADETSLEIASTDEVSLKVASVDETSLEVASTNEVPLKVASADEPSLEVASTDEVSLKVASVDETSLKVASADETPLKVASTDEVSVKEVLADETSLEVAAADETSLKVASEDETSLEVASTDETSPKVASTDEVSVKLVSADETSLEVASTDEVSLEIASADEVSLKVASTVVSTSSDDISVTTTSTESAETVAVASSISEKEPTTHPESTSDVTQSDSKLVESSDTVSNPPSATVTASSNDQSSSTESPAVADLSSLTTSSANHEATSSIPPNTAPIAESPALQEATSSTEASLVSNEASAAVPEAGAAAETESVSQFGETLATESITAAIAALKSGDETSAIATPTSLDETSSIPVGETSSIPVDETPTTTSATPLDETPATPVDETPATTPTTPVCETSATPVDETSSIPVDETPATTPTTPVDEPLATPVDETSATPVGETSATPVGETSVTQYATPVDEKSTITSSKSLDESPTITSSKSLDESPTITSSKSLDESPTITSSTSLDESPTIRSSKSLDESPIITSSKSLDKSPTITSSKSLDESPIITSSTSLDETLATQSATTVDETSATASSKPTDETTVTTSPVPADETKATKPFSPIEYTPATPPSTPQDEKSVLASSTFTDTTIITTSSLTSYEASPLQLDATPDITIFTQSKSESLKALSQSEVPPSKLIFLPISVQKAVTSPTLPIATSRLKSPITNSKRYDVSSFVATILPADHPSAKPTSPSRDTTFDTTYSTSVQRTTQFAPASWHSYDDNKITMTHSTRIINLNTAPSFHTDSSRTYIPPTDTTRALNDLLNNPLTGTKAQTSTYITLTNTPPFLNAPSVNYSKPQVTVPAITLSSSSDTWHPHGAPPVFRPTKFTPGSAQEPVGGQYATVSRFEVEKEGTRTKPIFQVSSPVSGKTVEVWRPSVWSPAQDKRPVTTQVSSFSSYPSVGQVQGHYSRTDGQNVARTTHQVSRKGYQDNLQNEGQNYHGSVSRKQEKLHAFGPPVEIHPEIGYQDKRFFHPNDNQHASMYDELSSPDSFGARQNLKAHRGRGGRLFERRKKRSDKFIIDETSIKTVAPTNKLDVMLSQPARKEMSPWQAAMTHGGNVEAAFSTLSEWEAIQKQPINRNPAQPKQNQPAVRPTLKRDESPSLLKSANFNRTARGWTSGRQSRADENLRCISPPRDPVVIETTQPASPRQDFNNKLKTWQHLAEPAYPDNTGQRWPVHQPDERENYYSTNRRGEWSRVAWEESPHPVNWSSQTQQVPLSRSWHSGSRPYPGYGNEADWRGYSNSSLAFNQPIIPGTDL